MIGIIAAALFFGCVAFLASYAANLICAGITPLADGPPSGKPPVAVLIVASAVIGGLAVARGNGTAVQIAILAIVVFACVAAWCSDVICGIIPDAFTLAPLGALLLFALTQHNWLVFLWALIPFAVFGFAAFFSNGTGMGWGDAKLVALAGAVLGIYALLMMAAACLAALVGSRLMGVRRGPIAFAPYIAAFVGIGVVLPIGWRL